MSRKTTLLLGVVRGAVTRMYVVPYMAECNSCMSASEVRFFPTSLTNRQIMIQTITKYILYAGTAIIAYIEPFLPYIQVCFIAIILDCLSAWDLARRVSATYPDKAKGGKFTSEGMKRIIDTILKISAVVWLTYMIDTTIVTFAEIYLANIVSAVFCTAQLVSILENISSCNGAKWAKLIQKVLVDKTNRHLNVDLTEEEYNKAKKTTKSKTKKNEQND